MFVFPEMPHFSHFQNQMGKMGHFRKNEQKKVGHFEKKARDRFENEKRTQNEYVRFWGISGKIAYARAKDLLQRLFGAFQDTSRNINC